MFALAIFYKYRDNVVKMMAYRIRCPGAAFQLLVQRRLIASKAKKKPSIMMAAAIDAMLSTPPKKNRFGELATGPRHLDFCIPPNHHSLLYLLTFSFRSFLFESTVWIGFTALTASVSSLSLGRSLRLTTSFTAAFVQKFAATSYEAAFWKKAEEMKISTVELIGLL